MLFLLPKIFKLKTEGYLFLLIVKIVSVPPFWSQIQAQMGLESLSEISRFRNILDFMGFKTKKSVAKLQRSKEFDRFLIESAKLNSNIRFRIANPGLNVDFFHGDILVLRDIIDAAALHTVDYDIGESRMQILYESTI